MKVLVLELYDGEIHQVDKDSKLGYKRMSFEKYVINLETETTMPQKKRDYRSDREINILQLFDKYKNLRKERLVTGIETFMLYFKKDSLRQVILLDENKTKDIDYIEEGLDDTTKLKIKNEIESLNSRIENNFQAIQNITVEMSEIEVEIHKKFTIPLAALLYILIGFPLGIKIRTGGFVSAFAVSLFFFIVHYVFLIGGEKLADRMIVKPWLAMWGPDILILIFGLCLLFPSIFKNSLLKFKSK